MKHRQETMERHKSLDPTQIGIFLALVALGLAFALGTLTYLMTTISMPIGTRRYCIR